MTTAMDVFVVTEIMQALWLYLAAPLLLLAGIVFTVQLRAPQFRRLPDAFRALRRSALSGPAGGDGMVAPGLSAALISAGQLGAATAVATATAVALGGPGALLYLWLFFLLIAPLRYAESWLAGTDAPGRGERAESLSLARRAMREKRWRFLGVLVTLSVAVSALAYGGVIQAEAMADSVSPLLPGAGVALVLGAAAAGTLLAIAGRSTAAIAGYLGLFGLAAFLIWILWAIGSAPGSAFGALGASFGAVFEGATRFEAFGGAFAGEVALAAMLHALPAFSAPTGADGAAQTLSTAPVRRQSAIALLPPFAMAVLGTLLCMALVGTGAYGERVETTMRLPEGQVFKVPANTAAERLEADRLFSGYIRTRAGEARNPAISYGTGRGAVEDAVVLYNGRAADLALHVEDGNAFRILRNTSGSTLGELPATNLWRVEIQGQMAPRGGALLAAAAQKAGGDLAAKLLLAALLALCAAAFAFWVSALQRSLPKAWPAALRHVAGLLPLGAGAWALLAPPLGLGALARLLLAVAVSIGTVALLLLSKQVRTLDR